MSLRLYHYVGPQNLKFLRRQGHCIQPSTSKEIFDWTANQPAPENRSRTIIATFVVDPQGSLWIADRRSEHISCADGGPVIAAGEITFEMNGLQIGVSEVSNLSTGFCPEPECWPAVAAALDRIGISHPDGFTDRFIFRRCPKCRAICLIKDDVMECTTCWQELPDEWNL